MNMNSKYLNYLFYVIILLVCVGLVFFLKKDDPGQACSLLKSGKFKYLSGSPDPSAYFVVEGDTVTEFNEYGEQFTKSVANWVGPCELEIRTVYSSYQDYEFDPNYRVKAYVSNVQGNKFDFKMVGATTSFDFEIEKVE